MAISRPTTKTKISTTEWGWPITDAVNANSTDIAALKAATAVTAWVNCTMQNGWVAYSVAPAYRKVGDIVYLRGNANGGTKNTVVFTLPVGFRPVAAANYIIYQWPSVPSSCFASTATNGTVTVDMINNAAGNPQYPSFDSIFFSTI